MKARRTAKRDGFAGVDDVDGAFVVGERYDSTRGGALTVEVYDAHMAPRAARELELHPLAGAHTSGGVEAIELLQAQRDDGVVDGAATAALRATSKPSRPWRAFHSANALCSTTTIAQARPASLPVFHVATTSARPAQLPVLAVHKRASIWARARPTALCVLASSTKAVSYR